MCCCEREEWHHEHIPHPHPGSAAHQSSPLPPIFSLAAHLQHLLRRRLRLGPPEPRRQHRGPAPRAARHQPPGPGRGAPADRVHGRAHLPGPHAAARADLPQPHGRVVRAREQPLAGRVRRHAADLREKGGEGGEGGRGGCGSEAGGKSKGAWSSRPSQRAATLLSSLFLSLSLSRTRPHMPSAPCLCAP